MAYAAPEIRHEFKTFSEHHAYFMTIEEIIAIIKTKEMVSMALSTYNRLLKSRLPAIDDIMLLPIKKHEAGGFFNFINHFQEQCSIIITTNKLPKQWAGTLDDEVPATVLPNRILYRCGVVKLSGSGYRMENRKTIFDQKKGGEERMEIKS